MKGYYLLFSILFTAFFVHAQKHDYNWIVGSYEPVYWFDRVEKITFSQDSIVSKIITNHHTFTYADNVSMSDSLGNLLFYSNGIQIYNTDGDIMENGNGINPGEVADTWNGVGYPIAYGMSSVRDSKNKNIYYLFHLGLTWSCDCILYKTKIDMSFNGGKGKVIEKNKVIFSGPYLYPINMVRHGNGRDWWLMAPDGYENKYYRFLIQDDTVIGPFEQGIGSLPVPHGPIENSPKIFSKDGSLYGNLNQKFGIEVFNFDRCTGLLSNERVELYDTLQPISYGGGIAFSPNERFLYVSSTDTSIIQYDLYEPDLSASKIKVNSFYPRPYPPNQFDLPQTQGNFGLMNLAPDDRIYIMSWNPVASFHLINSPNEKGMACQVWNDTVKLPSIIVKSIPAYPNYRLYDLPNSPCDTLGIDAPIDATIDPPKTKIQCITYPSPFHDNLNIKIEQPEARKHQFEIYNALGQLMYQTKVQYTITDITIDTKSYPSGLYFWVLLDQGKVVREGKVEKD